jgi:cyclomaltodextrinase/neopullulanase
LEREVSLNNLCKFKLLIGSNTRVFYQIFPDRFAKSQQPRKRLLQNASWEDWHAMPTLQGYKGGDLWGVMEQLDYLQDLGINAVILPQFFNLLVITAIIPMTIIKLTTMLGGNPAFKELLDAAHDRNIKIVLDGVFNHSSRGFFFFHDVLENGPHSPWVDWFKIEGWPLSAYNGDFPANYEGWDNNRALPVFNHENP